MSRTSTFYTRGLIALVLTCFLLAGLLPGGVQAAAGDLDQSFGNGGKQVTDFFFSIDQAQKVIPLADGRIIVAGSAFVINPDFAIARYTANGNLDPSFGNGGKVTIDFFGGQDFAFDAALQQDGKIIVVGWAAGDSRLGFAIARLNSDGSLDTTFGAGGKVFNHFGIGATAEAVAIQSDGKIVVGGDKSALFTVARYNPDGSLDTTFGNSGVVTTDFFGFGSDLRALAIQPDGKIVAAGHAFSDISFNNFALARYNTDGSLDTSFGTNGKVTTAFATGDGRAHDVALQTDGKIVAVGHTFNPQSSSFDFALARYNSDGSLDASFGTGGRITTDFFGEFDSANAVIIDPSGKIIAGGASGHFPAQNFGLARYNSDGSLDNTFGTGGKVVTDFLGSVDTVLSLAIQSDGKILAAGEAFSSTSGFDFAIARYKGDSQDPAFNLCLQDDSNGNLLQINTTTGEYQFTNCSRITIGGTGLLTKKGSTITLVHNAGDRRVLVKIDGAMKKAIASINLLSQSRTLTITDRNTANNSCACR